MADSTLLDIAKELGREQRKVVERSLTKADQDFVAPTSREIAVEYEELVAMGELVPPRNFVLDPNLPKKALVAAMDEVDPTGKIAERATLRRLLRAKKINIPVKTPTHTLVHMAMTSGCFGKQSKGDDA